MSGFIYPMPTSCHGLDFSSSNPMFLCLSRTPLPLSIPLSRCSMSLNFLMFLKPLLNQEHVISDKLTSFPSFTELRACHLRRTNIFPFFHRTWTAKTVVFLENRPASLNHGETTVIKATLSLSSQFMND